MTGLNPKGGPWLIWSNHWKRWHLRSSAGGAAGYTDDIAQAGIFDYPKANAYHDGPGGRDEAKTASSVLNEMHARRRALKQEYQVFAAKMEDVRGRFAAASVTNLGLQQMQVLGALDAMYHPEDWRAWSFRGLCGETGLTRDQVRRACKALRRLGFAKLEIGLSDEDGDLRGAGYRVTAAGHQWLSSRAPAQAAAA